MSIFLIIFLFFYQLVISNVEQVIYLIPFAGYPKDKFFDRADTFYNSDNRNEPFIKLRDVLKIAGYDLKSFDSNEPLNNYYGLIALDMPSGDALKRIISLQNNNTFLLLLEPPIVAPHYYDPINHSYFTKIFIMLDNWIDNTRYIKLYFPQTTLAFHENLKGFHDRKFCTLIASNKSSRHVHELYSRRLDIIRFFEEVIPQDFDFYGRSWHHSLYTTYKGCITYKHDILKHYKFCICYENSQSLKGYITEKIFDAFICGCIPIYWGADNITEYIPEECFIDRRKFHSESDLYIFLTRITEREYNNYKNHIKRFLEGPQAYLFSQDYFIKLMLNAFGIHYSKEMSGS